VPAPTTPQPRAASSHAERTTKKTTFIFHRWGSPHTENAAHDDARQRILRVKMLNGQMDEWALLLVRDGAQKGDTGACSCCPCGERCVDPRHAFC
jgi:hypothetical protein